jgi:hypothetical protein
MIRLASSVPFPAESKLPASGHTRTTLSDTLSEIC